MSQFSEWKFVTFFISSREINIENRELRENFFTRIKFHDWSVKIAISLKAY